MDAYVEPDSGATEPLLFVRSTPASAIPFAFAVSVYKLLLQIAGFASGIASDGSPAWSLVPFILVHGCNRFVLCPNLSSSSEPLVLHPGSSVQSLARSHLVGGPL